MDRVGGMTQTVYAGPLLLGPEGGGSPCAGWGRSRTGWRRRTFSPLLPPRVPSAACAWAGNQDMRGPSGPSFAFQGVWVPACLTQHGEVDQPQAVGVEIGWVVDLAEVGPGV